MKMVMCILTIGYSYIGVCIMVIILANKYKIQFVF